MKDLGYNNLLAVLPFDHRASFSKDLLGIEGEPGRDDVEIIKSYKRVIFDSIKEAISSGVPIENTAILVDDIYGKDILKEAKQAGIVTMQTVEKSGEEYFVPHYKDYMKELLEIKPTFAKALVRYNPEGDQEKNIISLSLLKEVSHKVRENGIKFLIEPLIIPTKLQLEKVGNDRKAFDDNLRPALTVAMINQMYLAGVEIDVFKIEGFNSEESYKAVVNKAREAGRDNVSIIVLGRNETLDNVLRWITEGAKVKGVIGFAVGRTLFLDPLRKLKNGTITINEAKAHIRDCYRMLYEAFINNKQK